MNSVRKKMALAVALVSAFTLAVGVTPALAADASDIRQYFELDGNIFHNSAVDWSDLFNVNGTAVPTVKGSLPSGFGPASFTRDFQFTNGVFGTGDNTTFATGSKDTQNISGGGQVNGSWQCATSNNIGDKVDLLNAYVVAFTAPNGDSILYFGLETASNEGTRDVAFWFLKGGAQCVAGRHATDFTGNHADGDLLVTAEYTGSNGVSEVKAFVWHGGANGSLDTNPSVPVGGDCSGSFPYLCGKTNGVPLIFSAFGVTDVPWLTHTKTSNPSQPNLTSSDLDVGEFFEGGINLTKNGLQACFTQFLADTRSSDTPSATIFDYTSGSFPLCGISVGKACVVDETSPKVNSDGETVHTKFSVPINNTGSSTVYDLTIQETITFTTKNSISEQCKITAISNNAVNPPSLPLTIGSVQGTPATKVSDSLGGKDTLTLTVECDSFTNPLVNSVTATAKTSSSLTTGDLTASHTVNTDPNKPPVESCSVTVNPSMKVDKACDSPAVTLIPGDGFNVCVVITVTNTSNEDLIEVNVTDNKAGTVVSNGTLDANSHTDYKKCYIASSADGNETDPSKAKFTDQISSASARGFISQKQISLTGTDLKSISCPLCPTCPTCP